MKRLAAISMMLVMAFAVQGQDIHFSQVDADPMLLNPAYAGFYQGAGRFGMLYRNQWATVSIPYQTFAFSGEVALWRSRNMSRGLSAGAMFFSTKPALVAKPASVLVNLTFAWFFALMVRRPT